MPQSRTRQQTEKDALLAAWYSDYYKTRDVKPWNISYSQESVAVCEDGDVPAVDLHRNSRLRHKVSAPACLYPRSTQFVVEHVDEPLYDAPRRAHVLPPFASRHLSLSRDPHKLSPVEMLHSHERSMHHATSEDHLRRLDCDNSSTTTATWNRTHALKHSCKLHNHLNQIQRSASDDDHSEDHADTDNRFKLFFRIWKDRCLLENNCKDETFATDCIDAVCPYLFKIFIAIFYITFGAFLYQLFDVNLEQEPYCNVLFFAFTTVTTIGYGNVVPTTRSGLIFTVFFIFFGVPTVFLVLSSFGETLAQFYWIFMTALKRQRKLITDHPHTMPAYIGMGLLHGHAVIGAFLFKYWLMPELTFLDAYYFSYISITTIGFGDISPVPKSMTEAVVMIVYLAVGIIILSAFVNSLIQVIRRLHYIGRTFSGAQHVEVYFAGARFTIRELLELVSLQFDVSPQQVKEVIYELDELINLTDRNNTDDCSNSADSVSSNEGEDTLMSPTSFHIPNGFNPQHRKSVNGSITSKKTNYTSRFSNEEQMKLIQAVSAICHLSDTGNRSFKSNSPLRCPVKSVPFTGRQ